MSTTKNRIATTTTAPIRCAIYTRKSTEDGLQQEFNSLDAQRDAGEAFIKSQQHEGWQCLPDRYDDGGFTGGNMERPALRRLMADIEAGRVDCVVVYKVDRLSRSLLDFARIMATFEQHGISFVSVTQQFNTANSMGRLMLNVLLSFAQFEREMISERTRDKIAATRRKGKWTGGMPLLGYDVVDSKLVVNEAEAEKVRQIFELYLTHGSLLSVVQELEQRGWYTKRWTTHKATERGGRPFDKNSLWNLLTNVTYLGKVRYKKEVHDGEHTSIISEEVWPRVQSLLRRNGRTGGSLQRNRFGALLKGILRCAACGCAMSPSHTTKRNRRYRYYVCCGAQKRGWTTCPTPSIPAGELERFVVDQIRCIGRDPQLIGATFHQLQQQASQRARDRHMEDLHLTRELAGYHRELQQLSPLLNGTPSARDVTKRLADVQDRIGAAERRLAAVREESRGLECQNTIDEASVAQAVAAFDPVWDTLSPHEQVQLVHLLIQQVDYNGHDGLITLSFHASGIQTLAHQTHAGATQ